MLNKALIATVVVVFQAAKAESDTDELPIEEAALAELIDDTIEETQDFAEDISWANRAQDPSEAGWFKGDTYQAKTKEEKMQDLWGQVMLDANDPEGPAPYMFEHLDDLFTTNANLAFCQKSDEMKKQGRGTRNKVAHTQGSVGRVKWENLGGHPYTGLFAEDSDTAIIRLSETSMLTAISPGLLPSIALKFLIDGKQSMNILSSVGPLPTTSWDFFASPMTNRIRAFDPVKESLFVDTFQKKLAQASPRPFATALSHIGKHKNDGSMLRNRDVEIPYQIEFRSKHHFDDAKELDVNGEQVMWYDQLKRIDVGDTLVEAWALTAPLDESLGDKKGKWIHIANVNLMTPLVTSRFADLRMHFQHKKVSLDRKFWPEEWRQLNEDLYIERWNEDGTPNLDNVWPKRGFTNGQEWPEDREDAEDKFVDQLISYGCPFAWLLGMD